MAATIERESKEFLAVPITVSGLPVGAEATIQFCVTDPDPATRPADDGWFPSTTLSGLTGFLVNPGDYPVGQHMVWYKVSGTGPEVVVKRAGKFTIA